MLKDETVLERDENGNPTKIHGYACDETCLSYRPPDGWKVISCRPAPGGSHGCCWYCLVIELVLAKEGGGGGGTPQNVPITFIIHDESGAELAGVSVYINGELIGETR